MKITAAFILAATSLVSGSPVYKRQDVSSVASSVASSASSAVESAVSSAASMSSEMMSESSSMMPSMTMSSAMPSGSATSDFGAGLLQALRERDATVLADLLEPRASELVPVLREGEWTILAPGNEYLTALPSNVTSNDTLVTNILQYHIVAGSYPVDALMTNMTVIPTTLAPAEHLGDNYTTLPLPFVKNVYGTTQFIGQNGTVVLANSTYENILIKLIDGVLSLPENVPTTIAANGGSALVGAITQYTPDIAQTLANAEGVTVFAPNNEAVSAVASALDGLPQDAIANIFQQHVLQGNYWSPNISDGLSLPTLAGNQMTFKVNGTGVFVSVGLAEAQVVATDFQANNGVVHYINQVLINPGDIPAGSSSSMSMAESMMSSMTESMMSSMSEATATASA